MVVADGQVDSCISCTRRSLIFRVVSGSSADATISGAALGSTLLWRTEATWARTGPFFRCLQIQMTSHRHFTSKHFFFNSEHIWKLSDWEVYSVYSSSLEWIPFFKEFNYSVFGRKLGLNKRLPREYTSAFWFWCEAMTPGSPRDEALWWVWKSLYVDLDWKPFVLLPLNHLIMAKCDQSWLRHPWIFQHYQLWWLQQMAGNPQGNINQLRSSRTASMASMAFASGSRFSGVTKFGRSSSKRRIGGFGMKKPLLTSWKPCFTKDHSETGTLNWKKIQKIQEISIE